MSAVLLVAALVAFPEAARAMDADQFDEFITGIEAGRLSEVDSFLHQSEESLSHDPDYFVILLNYAACKLEHPDIVIAKGFPGADDLALQDPKTGDTVGFISARGDHNEQLAFDAISRTQAALHSFSSRLDVRFGVVTVAENLERWDIVGDQLAEILEVSRSIDNKWTWGRINSMSDDPKPYMLSNVQAHVSQLFEQDSPIADNAINHASLAMIKCYPEVIFGYANLGALCLAREQCDKAEEYLTKALKIDPKDEIVLSNLNYLEKCRKK